ncbi:sensor histidine kinase [Bryobacter aggregatus]|uniref:sensor histidine kinase n=1 Tax=Bryobacter aggregatus TaxID=360054 RepID=UPI00068C5801|nr:ATP-binding protein [Bryobacter aggregatus]
MWRKRIFKGLRFRLALSYVIFFALLLTAFGFVLRGMLRNVVEGTVQGLLEEEWAACKGFLHITPAGKIAWKYDPNDKEEAAIVERLRLVYMIANDKGEVLESSELYRELGFDSPAIITQVMSDTKPSYTFQPNLRGQIFMVRQGILREKDARYFVALGRNFTPSLHVVNEFSLDYFSAVPIIILTAAGLGWLLAGRALQPVADVAAEVEKLSGSNLNLRVSPRGAGDELDHMIETFNGMVSRLEKSFQEIRQFSTDVSHELRTPITVVRGQLEVALMTAKTDEELRCAIESALLDIERLSQIIRALLQLAKAEGGQTALQMMDVDLVSLVSEVVSDLQIPALDRQVKLRALLPRQAIISGDRIQIERLLYNLIDNGIKYTREGGFVEVEIEVLESTGKILIEIRDNGRGIAPEHLPHLFDRLYRVPSRESGTEKGLGLGLSFVSWIVKAHNGEIQVRSELDKGTVFTVTFPIKAAEVKSVAEYGNQRETAGRYSNS